MATTCGVSCFAIVIVCGCGGGGAGCVAGGFVDAGSRQRPRPDADADGFDACKQRHRAFGERYDFDLPLNPFPTEKLRVRSRAINPRSIQLPNGWILI